MKNCLKICSILLLLTLFMDCDVTFDNELREYIHNIVERSPLKFSLAEGYDINGHHAVNMGFSLSAKEVLCVITNSESTAINLIAFEGFDSDFTITAIEAFTLETNGSFSFSVTYNPLASNFKRRVFKEVKFYDEGGRAYTFFLWATSRSQPLSIYNNYGELVTIYDLGNWSDSRNHTLVIKNEGLESLNVLSISSPDSGITITGDSPFHLDINEEKNLILNYNYNGNVVNAGHLTVVSDYSIDLSSGLTLNLYAGGSIPLNIFDSSGNNIHNSIDVGTFTGGNQVVKDYTFKNNSLFPMELKISMGNGGAFSTTLENSILIDPGENYNFQVSFYPIGEAGLKKSPVEVYDSKSGRTLFIQIVGNYSPI